MPRAMGQGVAIDPSPSNLGSSKWNEIFGDTVIATAILDRILHHSTTVNIKGNSYRLKEKVKAGLLRSPEIEEN